MNYCDYFFIRLKCIIVLKFGSTLKSIEFFNSYLYIIILFYVIFVRFLFMNILTLIITVMMKQPHY